MPEPNNVLDVLTVKRGDNRPTLEMSLAEINQAVEQPTDDAAWDKYTAEELSAGNRHELHMDWYDPAADETVRVVDGREATWDGTTETISIQLQRSDVSREGEYYFEWVVIYDDPDADGNVPTSETANEVNTIPSLGFFNLSVEEPTQRALGAVEPINRTVGRLTVEDYIRGPNGPLSLAASPPEDPYHATHKQYVDAGDQESADALAGHEQAGQHNQTQFGENLAETITETTSPASFTFTAGDNRDILDVADVTLSNGTTASVTEDITVDLHDGVDATAPVIASETKSVTVAAGATVTEAFIAGDTALGAGDYHIEVGQSGVDLSIDETAIQTLGGEYTTTETDAGDLVTTDHRGRERRRYDAIENRTTFPGGIESSEAAIDDLNGVLHVSPADGSAGLQEALTAADPGGIVNVRAGELTITETVDIGGLSDVTLRGDDATLRAADNLDDQMFNNVTGAAVENFTIEGVTLDGNAVGQDLLNATSSYVIGDINAGDSLTLRNIEMVDTPNNGLVTTGLDNCRVVDCEFDNIGHPDAPNTAVPVALNGGSGHVIAFNEFGWATDNAIFSRNNGTLVFGNHFRECMVYLMASGSHNQFYLFNEIEGAPKEPFTGAVLTSRRFFRFNQNDLTNIHLVGNTVHGLDADCAMFAEATDNTVTGLENIHLRYNTVYGGTFLSDGVIWNAPVEGFSAIGNFVTQTKRNGMRFNGIKRATISENTAYNTNTNGDSFVWPLDVGRGDTTVNQHITVANNKSIDDRATKTHYQGFAVRTTGGGWINVHDNIVDGAVNAERNVDTAIPHLVYNGLGYNDGDPGVGGQWSGEGYEGLRVFDTTNSVMYQYANGAWR